MIQSFTHRAAVPDDVLIRELEGEAVLLNLANNSYYGLDSVGTDMWRALTTAGSIEEAYQSLLEEYDVEPDVLRRDIKALLEKLVGQGLLQLAD